MGLNGVVGASKSCDVVEKNDDVVATLDQAPCFFNAHFSDLNVALWRFIKCGRNDFALHSANHVCNFFWTLINQKNYDRYFRIVHFKGVCDVLQKNCFSGFWLSDDERALPFSNRR